MVEEHVSKPAIDIVVMGEFLYAHREGGSVRIWCGIDSNAECFRIMRRPDIILCITSGPVSGHPTREIEVTGSYTEVDRNGSEVEYEVPLK